MRDADISIHKHKMALGQASPRQLELLSEDDELRGANGVHGQEIDTEWQPGDRKSPEAKFGSQGMGTVILPPELVNAIEGLIQGEHRPSSANQRLIVPKERDKHTLRNDAKRLFSTEDQDASKSWHTNYDTHYKSHKQATRHADRDGTAFASVALPAHFSVIHAVLEHTKHRLEKTWRIDSVIEWGTAVGSGIWLVNSAPPLQKKCRHQLLGRPYTRFKKIALEVSPSRRICRQRRYQRLDRTWLLIIG